MSSLRVNALSETRSVSEVPPATENGPAPLRGSGKRGGRRLRLGKAAPFGWALGPVLLIVYWSIGSATGHIDPRILPAPWVAISTAGELIEQGRLQSNLLVSTQRAALGLFFGLVTGVGVALIAGLTRIGDYLFDGLVQIKRAVPTFALIPFFVLWFGIGEAMKVTVIAIGVFYPIYLHTHNGLRGIDVRYVELAETLRVSYVDFIRHIVLPGALPGFLLGLRFAVMAAWLSLVVVEQMNSTAGIGHMMELARSYAQTNVILVGIVTYGVLGVSSDAAVRLLQKRLLSWRRTLEN